MAEEALTAMKALTLEEATAYLFGDEQPPAFTVALTKDADHPLPAFRRGDRLFFSQAAIDAWVAYWEAQRED